MVSTSSETPCVKCTKTNCIAMCFGCRQAFCTRHFIKHRLVLSQQADELHEKYEHFQNELQRNDFGHSLRSTIDAWEHSAIAKIQAVAEKARGDLQQWMDKTRDDFQITLKRMAADFASAAKIDNYTETELASWQSELTELRAALEKPTTISIVEDGKSSSFVRRIRVVHQSEPSSPISVPDVSKDVIKPTPEHFKLIFGPGKLSEDDLRATHCNYRAGLSQISGDNEYSLGKHSIQFLIVKKGTKNIFLGIQSSSKQLPSANFDSSVHGWWNLDYMIVNGESAGGDSNESIQTGDKMSLTIDCDNQQIQLEHQRTNRLVSLPIRLDQCPFPWKLLVRLLGTGDSVQLLT